MTTLGSALAGIAVDLNDAEPGHEFAHWSRAQIVGYINEATALIASLRPTLYGKSEVVKLQPGTDQTAGACCTTIQTVVGQCDQYGNLVGGALPRRADAALFRWTKPGCPPKGGTRAFQLTGYWLPTMSHGEFSVVPPVPPNTDVYVKLRCTQPPDAVSVSDTAVDIGDGQTVAAIRQWVLYRCMIIDNESQTGSTVALHHLQLFFTILQVQFSRELLAQLGTTLTPQVKDALTILRATGALSSPMTMATRGG